MPIDNKIQFSGKLIRRQYKPGQKYVQLVFQTGDGLRLSLSRNAKMVHSLVIGQTYRISGGEYLIGNKSYVHEPSATLIPSKGRFFANKLAAGAAVLVLAIGTTATVFLTNRGDDTQLNATNVSAQQQPIVEEPEAGNGQAAGAATTQAEPTPPAPAEEQPLTPTPPPPPSEEPVIPPPVTTPEEPTTTEG